MSYVVSIIISCDEPGCPRQISMEHENRGGLSKTWAGHMAVIRHGWQIRGHDSGRADPKVAYCRDHKR